MHGRDPAAIPDEMNANAPEAQARTAPGRSRRRNIDEKQPGVSGTGPLKGDVGTNSTLFFKKRQKTDGILIGCTIKKFFHE